jgi:hypothetical protein
MRNQALAHAQAHRAETLAALQEFMRITSISTYPSMRPICGGPPLAFR